VVVVMIVAGAVEGSGLLQRNSLEKK